MKQLLKTDLENIKEAFRRFSCFEGKESVKMILLAFPSEVDNGRYSPFLFTPYSTPQKRILNWYNAGPELMTIFERIGKSGIYADYDGLYNDNAPHRIDSIIREIAIDVLENSNAPVECVA
ncbi:hypothetical protein [Candidatus Ulvibacter alkanivorans]|uniref:hypothetical protein n=1 Tax=Candidatus Ulvibacter alkanivorans TaxID=2267620 RepID=UPI000DF472E2|nr:hypothetical protein [Candidatus Ulvibacter alkanivorans]